MRPRTVRFAWGRFLLVLCIALGVSRVARADAVDEAFARGNAAHAEGDLEGARAAYEEAARLLGRPNAVLAYNLGTTYAMLGDLGRGAYYLTVALDPRTHPTPEIAERARVNLEVVRRRAEVLAAAEKAQLDRPASWWEILLDAARAPWVGWTALVAGLAGLLAWAVERRLRPGPAAAATQAFVVLAGLAYVLLGVLHGLALRADVVAPRGILLGRIVEVRQRPSPHAQPAFRAVGGTRVRLEERVSGFVRVRLPGSLTGYVPRKAVGDLEAIDRGFVRALAGRGATPAAAGAGAPASSAQASSAGGPAGGGAGSNR